MSTDKPREMWFADNDNYSPEAALAGKHKVCCYIEKFDYLAICKERDALLQQRADLLAEVERMKAQIEGWLNV